MPFKNDLIRISSKFVIIINYLSDVEKTCMFIDKIFSDAESILKIDIKFLSNMKVKFEKLRKKCKSDV